MHVDLRRWAPSLTAFSQWLEKQSHVAAREWSGRLNSNAGEKVEGAVAEAAAWDYFTCRVDSVRLADEPGTGGVDFEFMNNGKSFLIEVTNMSTETCTEMCGFSDTEIKAGSYGLLTEKIRHKVRGKFEQVMAYCAASQVIIQPRFPTKACLNHAAQARFQPLE